MKPVKPGWRKGISNLEYHQMKRCISQSFLKNFMRSPAHARYSEWKSTPQMIIGSAFHSTILGFNDDVIVVDTPKTPKEVNGKYQIHIDDKKI